MEQKKELTIDYVVIIALLYRQDPYGYKAMNCKQMGTTTLLLSMKPHSLRALETPTRTASQLLGATMCRTIF